MELKKVIENLRVKSDVCLLNKDELIAKYCSDKDTYNNFLEIFSRVFSGRRIFPLLVSFKYRDIESVIETGNDFVTDDTEIFQVAILREIYKNEHHPDLDIRGDDYGQAISIFNSSLCADRVKNDKASVGEKMKAMLECAEIYDSSNKEISIGCFDDYLVDCYNSGDFSDYVCNFDTFISEFLEKNPKFKLCYNNNFLYFVNYLLGSYSSLCDQEFLDFSKSVIEISSTDTELMPEDFSKADYLKLSKSTLQKIDALERNRNKEDKPKRKILDFLKKKS